MIDYMIDSILSLKYNQQTAGAYFNPFAAQAYNQNTLKPQKEGAGSFGGDDISKILGSYDNRSTLSRPVEKNDVLGRNLDTSF